MNLHERRVKDWAKQFPDIRKCYIDDVRVRPETYDAVQAELARMREENEQLRGLWTTMQEAISQILKARTAISEVEPSNPWGGKNTPQRRSEVEGEKERYRGFGTDDEEAWDDPDKETT